MQEAIYVARKSGATCNTYFAKCPYSMDSINRSLTSYAEKYAMRQENVDEFTDSFNDIQL